MIPDGPVFATQPYILSVPLLASAATATSLSTLTHAMLTPLEAMPPVHSKHVLKKLLMSLFVPCNVWLGGFVLCISHIH